MESASRTAFHLRHGRMPGTPSWSLYLVAVVMFCVTSLCNGEDAVIWSGTRIETSDITCWTCKDKKNNDACNDWAPDLRCPLNHTVCLTRHRFDSSTGMSLLVNKQCAQPVDCTSTHVGCTMTDAARGEQECVSCCDYSYCNQDVPCNRSSALRLSKFTIVSNTGSHLTTSLNTALLVVLCYFPVAPLLSHFGHIWTS